MRTDVELTEIERECGVTEDAVHRIIRRAHFLKGKMMMDEDTGPALAGAAARHALGPGAEFLGLNALGHIVYGRN